MSKDEEKAKIEKIDEEPIPVENPHEELFDDDTEVENDV